MEAFILSAVEQGVMTITLNRPDRLNSFNDLMHHQLAECLKQAERDDGVRCLLITGAGRGFCAGRDLNDRNVDPSGPPPDLGMSVERFTTRWYAVWRRCRNRSSARLTAWPPARALPGAGLRYRAGRAFGQICDGVQQARPGAGLRRQLVPAAGGRPCARDGAGAAGRQPQRGTGRAVGIIWQLVDDSELADTSLQLARHLAAQPTFGLGLIKRRCWLLKPTVSTRSWTRSAIISVWPGAAMITAKGSARFWPNGHHSSAGNR